MVEISEILADEDLTGVSAIAIIDDTQFIDADLGSSRYYVFGRNISDLTVPKKDTETQEEYEARIAEAKKDWTIQPIRKAQNIPQKQ